MESVRQKCSFLKFSSNFDPFRLEIYEAVTLKKFALNTVTLASFTNLAMSNPERVLVAFFKLASRLNPETPFVSVVVIRNCV